MPTDPAFLDRPDQTISPPDDLDAVDVVPCDTEEESAGSGLPPTSRVFRLEPGQLPISPPADFKPPSVFLRRQYVSFEDLVLDFEERARQALTASKVAMPEEALSLVAGVRQIVEKEKSDFISRYGPLKGIILAVNFLTPKQTVSDSSFLAWIGNALFQKGNRSEAAFFMAGARTIDRLELQHAQFQTHQWRVAELKNEADSGARVKTSRPFRMRPADKFLTYEMVAGISTPEVEGFTKVDQDAYRLWDALIHSHVPDLPPLEMRGRALESVRKAVPGLVSVAQEVLGSSLYVLGTARPPFKDKGDYRGLIEQAALRLGLPFRPHPEFHRLVAKQWEARLCRSRVLFESRMGAELPIDESLEDIRREDRLFKVLWFVLKERLRAGQPLAPLSEAGIDAVIYHLRHPVNRQVIVSYWSWILELQAKYKEMGSGAETQANADADTEASKPSSGVPVVAPVASKDLHQVNIPNPSISMTTEQPALSGLAPVHEPPSYESCLVRPLTAGEVRLVAALLGEVGFDLKAFETLLTTGLDGSNPSSVRRLAILNNKGGAFHPLAKEVATNLFGGTLLTPRKALTRIANDCRQRINRPVDPDLFYWAITHVLRLFEETAIDWQVPFRIPLRPKLREFWDKQYDETGNWLKSHESLMAGAPREVMEWLLAHDSLFVALLRLLASDKWAHTISARIIPYDFCQEFPHHFNGPLTGPIFCHYHYLVGKQTTPAFREWVRQSEKAPAPALRHQPGSLSLSRQAPQTLSNLVYSRARHPFVDAAFRIVPGRR